MDSQPSFYELRVHVAVSCDKCDHLIISFFIPRHHLYF